jgi:hypothetical protein
MAPPRRSSLILVAAEALLLLVPVTLFCAFVLYVAYPAYPLPRISFVAIAFDIAFVLCGAATVAAWRLIAVYLRHGRAGLHQEPAIWWALLWTGALLGLFGVAMAGVLLVIEGAPPDVTGFALLAPAALLTVPAVHLAWERRRASG